MHAGLRYDVADFRKCTRTTKLDPVSSFTYWHMRWHREHHTYAGVPCYKLRRLNRAIAADLPEPLEVRATWRRQQVEPGYQHDTPVLTLAPAAAQTAATDDTLSASIGDLAPEALAGN